MIGPELLTTGGAKITLRPAAEGDDAFLHELYADRRAPELAAVGWPEATARQFLDMQFRAQRQGYLATFPDADDRIVVEGQAPVARLLVDRRPDEHLVVDLAVLTRARGRGIGAALIGAVVDDAAAAGVRVRLTASLSDPGLIHWYERLGFHVIERRDVDVSMVREVPTARTVPSARLPWRFDARALRSDVEALTAADWVPHFNTRNYEGDWSGAALRSVGGQEGRLYPDPSGSALFADTPLLARCPGTQAVLSRLQCPLLAVRFLRLGPGSRIREHRDLNLGYDDGEVRIHVPVSTDPGVEFLLDGRPVDMGEGEAWYLDLNLPHSVVNPGPAVRVHLVVDCVVDDWLDAVLAESLIPG